jgi:hypothetical protein
VIGFAGDPSAPLEMAEIGFLVLKSMRWTKKTLSSRTHVRDLLPVHSGLSENPTKRSLIAALDARLKALQV